MNNNIEINSRKELQYQLYKLKNKNKRDKLFSVFFPNIINAAICGYLFTDVLSNITNLYSNESINNQRKWLIALGVMYLSSIVFYLIFTFIRNLFKRANDSKISNNIGNKLFPILLLYILSLFVSIIVMHNLLNEKIIEFMSLHKMNLFIDRLEALSSILNQKKGYLVMYGCLALIYFGFNYNLIKYQISKYKEHEEAENEIFEKAQEKNQKINLIDQVEIFSAIQHELANCIPTLINDFNDFIDYLNINTDFKNELKKPIFEGSNETVEILINTIRKKANRAILTTTDFSEIIKSNPKYFQPESLNLCMYIKQEFNKHTDSSINIIYNCNENIICEIDKMQFSYVIKNLISNAVRHGFQNSTNKIIEVDILKAEAIKNDEKVLIRIKNNGEAIKEGFTIEDFKTLYKKSGEFGNTGIGGYNINIILLNHGGDIKYNNEIIKNTEFNVCFEITLPFKL
jgi:signal transduction histidine kinase